MSQARCPLLPPPPSSLLYQHVLQVQDGKLFPTFTLPAEDGVFHSMATGVPARVGALIWTTCDKANVTLVHDVATYTRLATIPLPARVAALGGVPHDTHSNNRFGYVTYIKNSDGAGYVGVYDIVNFKLVRLVKTAADPHVGLFSDSEVLVAS